MEKKVVYAKCPYCKAEQNFHTSKGSHLWSQGISLLHAEYYSKSVKIDCADCGESMIVKAKQTIRYSASKVK